MAAAGPLGMLMNFLALWLMACVAWMALARIISFARKRLYMGIWKPSEYPASRSHLLQAVEEEQPKKRSKKSKIRVCFQRISDVLPARAERAKW